MSLFLAIHVEGHRREDGVQGQVHPSEEYVHVLVLDPHVRAPERETAEAARGDPDFAEDLCMASASFSLVVDRLTQVVSPPDLSRVYYAQDSSRYNFLRLLAV